MFKSPDQRAWWQRPVIIMGNQYPCDIPRTSDEKTLRELVKFKRSLGFDTEHLLANSSMLEGEEGGDDSKLYLFRNRHGFREDYLGKYLPIAREYGLRVLVYFNCHWFRSTSFPTDHFMLDAGGKAVQLYGNGRGVCPRGPFRKWSKEMAEDLGRYEIDGVFLDGPVQRLCFCAACREEFRRRHAAELPASEGECPVELLEAYRSFAADGASGYVREFSQGLRSTNPLAALYLNDVAPGDGRVMAATTDCTQLVGSEGGFVGYEPLNDAFPFTAGAAAKVLEARSEGRGRVVFCDCGYKNYDYHAHPRGEIARMYAGTIANGANPWLLVLRSAQQTPGLQVAVRFNQLIDENRATLAGSESLATAAILLSTLNLRLGQSAKHEARDDVGHRDTAAQMTMSRHAGEYRGMYSALARSGYPFDVIEEVHLLKGDLPQRLKLIILPGVGAISDGVAEKLRQFVAAGGSVLATFDTSLFNEDGSRRKDFAMSDVFGASVVGEMCGPSRLDYLAVTSSTELMRGIVQKMLPCPEYWWLVKAGSGAEALLHYHEKMPRRYAMPPAISAHPAAIIHTHGQGRAILIPSAMASHFLDWNMPDHRLLLANASRLLAKPPVELEGAGEFVETTLRMGENGAIALHLTNWASGRRPSTGALSLGPIRVSVTLPKGMRVTEIRRQYEPAPLRYELGDGTVRFALDRLGDYEMVLIR